MQNSVTELPFNRFVGIRIASSADGMLELPAAEHYLNHIGTVHASAQLALAEASSGEYLLKNLQTNVAVIPVVRRVEAKYRKPARGRIVAKVAEPVPDISKALEDIAKKGRCLLTVTINVHDEHGQHSLTAAFDWFLSRVSAES